MGLSFAPIYAKGENAEWSDVPLWSQTVIDLADGDPCKGNFMIGSPLALAYTTRGMARCCLGHPGWRDDQRHGLAMARRSDALSDARVVTHVYFPGIPNGALGPTIGRCARSRMPYRMPNDPVMIWRWPSPVGRWALRWRTAQRLRSVTADTSSQPRSAKCSCAGDTALAIYRPSMSTSRVRGLSVVIAIMRYRSCAPPSTGSLPRGTAAGLGTPATSVLVETLLDRGNDDDVAEAEAAIERLAAAPADEGLAIENVVAAAARPAGAGAR